MKSTLLTALICTCLITACRKPNEPAGINKEVYIIPGNNFFPEGIAYNPYAGIFYTGSFTSGNIVAADVETGDVKLFAQGQSQNRKSALGMKLDKLKRLWVCGGPDNKIQVLSPIGTLIKSWDTKALFSSGFINDCIIDESHVYFTDSQVKKIYRISVNNIIPGEPEVWLSFTNAQLPYVAGEFNANGIEATPDNKYLILVNSFTGKLYRINKATKNITEIILNKPVTYGDGLYLDGNILYVSRNALNLIFPVTLNEDYTQGTVGIAFGRNKNLLYNTTIAKAGDYFLVVNGQLNRAGGKPNLPFTVSRVKIPD